MTEETSTERAYRMVEDAINSARADGEAVGFEKSRDSIKDEAKDLANMERDKFLDQGREQGCNESQRLIDAAAEEGFNKGVKEATEIEGRKIDKKSHHRGFVDGRDEGHAAGVTEGHEAGCRLGFAAGFEDATLKAQSTQLRRSR